MEFLETITKLGPAAALFAACNILGFVIKRTDVVNDRYIPAILVMFSGMIYPFVAEIAVVPFNVPYPFVYNMLIGLGIGGASVGGNQVLRKLVGEEPRQPPPEDPPASPPMSRKPLPPITRL